jgi:putative ABC transport system ATP-binding protein
MISMRNVTKVYQTGKVEVEALRGITIDFERGEFISIMGPSGSGKSTLMNIMGCLDVPSSGIYFLDGEEVQGLHHNRLAEIRNEKVGFVFQNFNLLPYATARENVEMPMIFRGTPARERIRKAEEALSLVMLDDRMDHKPSELSGGEMQRVAIARSLANDPTIILADEPTGNLDSASGKEILNLFSNLWKQGRTVIIITHDANIARESNRIIHMKDGLISEDGPNHL